jgi:hypothetical protein
VSKNAKTTEDGKEETWRQQRAKIRGTGEASISPRLNAAQIKEVFSPGITGAYVNEEGSCVKGALSTANSNTTSKVINHTIDAVYMVAKALCPSDPRTLVNKVSEFLLSRDTHVVNGRQISYEDWSKQRLVDLHLTEFQKAQKDNNRNRQKKILSWVASTNVKKKWISELFDVSYCRVRTARRHANIWNPGGEKRRLSLGKKSYRQSPRSAYLQKWVKDNSTPDPAGKKSVVTRLIPRYSQHHLYLFDVKKAKAKGEHPGKPYSQSRFYTHPAQKGITNSNCSAGLCSICARHGTEVFDFLSQHADTITMMMKAVLPFDLVKWKNDFKKVRKYFQRGGMFQRNLKMSCNNIHHCLQFALSHPTQEMYQHKCQHDHTEVDDVCLLRDRLWQELYDFIDGALDSEDEKVVGHLKKKGLVGELASTTYADKLRNVRKDLQQRLKQHDKYVGHLMLESAQTKMRFKLRKNVSFTYTQTYTYARTYTCTYTERQTHPLVHH